LTLIQDLTEFNPPWRRIKIRGIFRQVSAIFKVTNKISKHCLSRLCQVPFQGDLPVGDLIFKMSDARLTLIILKTNGLFNLKCSISGDCD
jgi:hypothetical protein